MQTISLHNELIRYSTASSTIKLFVVPFPRRIEQAADSIGKHHRKQNTGKITLHYNYIEIL